MVNDERLEARNVTAWYGRGSPVLVGINASFEPKHLTVLYGPNGGGKSTLLHVIMGLHRRFQGSIVYGGVDLARQGERTWARWRAQNAAYMPQEDLFFEGMSVWDNISYYLRVAGIKIDDVVADRIKSLAEKLGIEHLLKRKPSSLSGGEKRKASLLRALVKSHARVLIVDEPTASLDDVSARLVAKLLREEAEGGRIVIVATHDPLIIGVAHRRLELRAGRLRFVGD